MEQKHNPNHWGLNTDWPTINDKIHCQTAENGVVLDTTSNLKLLLETIWSG